MQVIKSEAQNNQPGMEIAKDVVQTLFKDPITGKLQIMKNEHYAQEFKLLSNTAETTIEMSTSKAADKQEGEND